MSFFSNDKFASSNESADEKIDFMEYVGTVAVSDSNSNEESTSTRVPVTTEQSMCSSQPHSALVRQDDSSADVPDARIDDSNSFSENPQDVESSMLADSSAFDLWRSSEDSSDDEHTSEPEGVTNISTQQDSEVDSTNSDDGADDRDTSESDASQGGSTIHESYPAVSITDSRQQTTSEGQRTWSCSVEGQWMWSCSVEGQWTQSCSVEGQRMWSCSVEGQWTQSCSVEGQRMWSCSVEGQWTQSCSVEGQWTWSCSIKWLRTWSLKSKRT